MTISLVIDPDHTTYRPIAAYILKEQADFHLAWLLQQKGATRVYRYDVELETSLPDEMTK
jgi:hypothetical protein